MNILSPRTFIQGFCGEFIRNHDPERQAFTKANLPVKKADCFGGGHSQLFQHPLSLFLRLGLNPGMYYG